MSEQKYYIDNLLKILVLQHYNTKALDHRFPYLVGYLNGEGNFIDESNEELFYKVPIANHFELEATNDIFLDKIINKKVVLSPIRYDYFQRHIYSMYKHVNYDTFKRMTDHRENLIELKNELIKYLYRVICTVNEDNTYNFVYKFMSHEEFSPSLPFANVFMEESDYYMKYLKIV